MGWGLANHFFCLCLRTVQQRRLTSSRWLAKFAKKSSTFSCTAAHRVPRQRLAVGSWRTQPQMARLVKDRGVEVWAVAGQVHQVQVQAGRGQVRPQRIATMGWCIVPNHGQRFVIPRPSCRRKAAEVVELLLPSSSITSTSPVSRHTAE